MTKRRKLIFGVFTGLASCALLGTASTACAMISHNRQVELRNLQSSTDELAQAQTQINQLKSQCEAYQNQIQTMSEELKSSNSSSSSAPTKIPSDDKKLTPSDDVAPWLENKLKSLTSYLNKIKEDLINAQNTINEQQAANKKLQQSLTNATSTQQITQQQYQDSQNTIKDLQSQIKNLQDELQNANSQINSFNFNDISMYQVNMQLVSPYGPHGPYASSPSQPSGTAINGANNTSNNSITNPIQISMNLPLAMTHKEAGGNALLPYYFGAANLTGVGLNGSDATIPNAGVVLVNPNMTPTQIQQAIQTEFNYNSNGVEGSLPTFPLYFTLMPTSYLSTVGSGNNHYTFANPSTSAYKPDNNNDPMFKTPFSNVEPDALPSSFTQGTYAWFLGSSLDGAPSNYFSRGLLGGQIAVGTIDLATTHTITFEICLVSQNGSWFGTPYMFYQITINIENPTILHS